MVCDLALLLKSRECLGYGRECLETVVEGGKVGCSSGDLNQNYFDCSTTVPSGTTLVIYIYHFSVS